MREFLAIATIVTLLAAFGAEPRQLQAKSCQSGMIASLLDAC